MLAAFQRSLIYRPEQVAAVRPADFGWKDDRCQPVEQVADDGVPLHGWLLLAEGQTARSPAEFDEQLQRGRPVILYFCGNGGHRGYRQAPLATLTSLGCDVFIFDYRGYGDNAGSPTETALIADANTIFRRIVETRCVAASRIIVYGESLGGGVATGLTAELCRAKLEPGGLIVQSSFPSLVATGRIHYPWLPVRWLLIDRFPSAERMAHVTCPVLHIHGRLDEVIPWNQGEELYAAIPARSADGTPKARIELPNTPHKNVYAADSPDRGALLEGLKQYLNRIRRKPGPTPC